MLCPTSPHSGKTLLLMSLLVLLHFYLKPSRATSTWPSSFPWSCLSRLKGTQSFTYATEQPQRDAVWLCILSCCTRSIARFPCRLHPWVWCGMALSPRTGLPTHGSVAMFRAGPKDYVTHLDLRSAPEKQLGVYRYQFGKDAYHPAWIHNYQ